MTENIDDISAYIRNAVQTEIVHAFTDFNDDVTRERVSNVLNNDFAQFNTTHHIMVVCDKSNNPPSVIDESNFIIDVYFKENDSPTYNHIRGTAIPPVVNEHKEVAVN